MADYLAFVLIGGGSSWGRSPNKEIAIDNCMRSLRDWETYFKIEGQTMKVNVMDVDGYDTVVWEGRGVFGKNPGDEKMTKLERDIEVIDKVYTKKRKKK